MSFSACNLTSGEATACVNSIGGVDEIRVIAWENLGTVTASSGNVTGITPTGSEKFWKYNLPPKNKDYLKSDPQKNNDAGTLFWKQELQLTIRKLSAAHRNEIKLLAQQRLAFIVKDRNGTFWLAGKQNGLEMETSEATTGTAREEFNGYVLKFMGEENDDIFTVSSAIIDALTN